MGGARAAGRAVGSALLAGLVLGALWWWLAPEVTGRVVAGEIDFPLTTELQIAQDGWLAAILGVVGMSVAVFQGFRRKTQSVISLLATVSWVGLVGFIAWQWGEYLGPEDLKAQLAAGQPNEVVTPLVLHSIGVLLVGPMLYCTVRSLVAFLTADSGASSATLAAEPDR